MTFAVGQAVHVYTGRGWRTGKIDATGPGVTWVTYMVGSARRQVRVSDPRHIRCAKEKRPKSKDAPAATRVQMSLFD